MVRSIILAYWELRSMLRSRKIVFVVLFVPAAGIIACVTPFGARNLALRCFFPAAVVIFTWILLYLRSLSDRASGFAAGIESTPVVGTVSFTARVLIGLLIILVQTAAFYAGVRVIG